MANCDIRNLIDLIFDGVDDWYALADEVGNYEASVMLNGYDALAHIDDEDIHILISSSYSTLKMCIAPGQRNYQRIWDIVAKRASEAADELVDNGYIHPGSVYFEIDPYDKTYAAIYYEN